MTNSNSAASLDEVLAEYAHAAEEFDSSVLQTFIDKYPQHSRELQRYAHIQLISVRASQDEIDNEQVSDDEMLPRQSRLLQRLQQLRGMPSAVGASKALKALATISGEKALQAAATAIFGSCERGEDLLLLRIVDSPSEVQDVPNWFLESLGEHIHATPPAVIAAMSMRRQQSQHPLRFSAKNKPEASRAITWEEAVQECVTDESVKRAILARTPPP
jgi:hypothetical protein